MLIWLLDMRLLVAIIEVGTIGKLVKGGNDMDTFSVFIDNVEYRIMADSADIACEKAKELAKEK